MYKKLPWPDYCRFFLLDDIFFPKIEQLVVLESRQVSHLDSTFRLEFKVKIELKLKLECIKLVIHQCSSTKLDKITSSLLAERPDETHSSRTDLSMRNYRYVL